MIGEDFLFLRVDDARLPLEPTHHAVDGLVEVGHVHRILSLARSMQRGLVEEVGENVLPSPEVGTVEDDLAIEAPFGRQRAADGVLVEGEMN